MPGSMPRPALPVGAVTQSEIDALKARQAESQERQAELEEQLTRAEADRLAEALAQASQSVFPVMS